MHSSAEPAVNRTHLVLLGDGRAESLEHFAPKLGLGKESRERINDQEEHVFIFLALLFKLVLI